MGKDHPQPTTPIPSDVGMPLNSHPAVLNGFIDLVREEHLRRQPLTAEDIQAEAERILRELRAPDMPEQPPRDPLHGPHFPGVSESVPGAKTMIG